MSTVVPEVAEYTGVVPSRTQSQSDFNDNVGDFLNYIDTFGPDLNDTVVDLNLAVGEVNSDAATASGAAATATAAANATAYSGSATYNYPDTVIGSDGHAYRCIDTGVTGDDPVGSTTGDWQPITTDTQDVVDLIDGRVNLLWNPDFTVNQENKLSGIAPGTYGPDFWFTPNEESNNSEIIFLSGGIIRLGNTDYGVIAQLINRRTFNQAGTIQVGGIFEGDYVTISADMETGSSMEVWAGYGTASGSNLTTVKKGDLTDSNREVTFQVDYNSSNSNYLAIKLVATETETPDKARFKNLKLNIGQKATPYEQPNNDEQLAEAHRWYRRSYNYGTTSGTVTDTGAIFGKNWSAASQTVIDNVCGNVPHMRGTPSVTIYSPGDGASGNIYDIGAATNRAVSGVPGLGEIGFTRISLSVGVPATNPWKLHYVLNARL